MNPSPSCSTCNTPADPDDLFCSNCGTALESSTTWNWSVPPRNDEFDFIPLNVTPIYHDPEPTGFRRFTERFGRPKLRHG